MLKIGRAAWRGRVEISGGLESDVCSSDLLDVKLQISEGVVVGPCFIDLARIQSERDDRFADAEDRKSGVEGKSGDLGGAGVRRVLFRSARCETPDIRGSCRWPVLHRSGSDSIRTRRSLRRC